MKYLLGTAFVILAAVQILVMMQHRAMIRVFEQSNFKESAKVLKKATIIDLVSVIAWLLAAFCEFIQK